jgi:hypothetical protein
MQIQEFFNRAVARGEFSPDTDPEPILKLAASIVYWRMIVRAPPVTDDYLRTVVAIIQNGLMPS